MFVLPRFSFVGEIQADCTECDVWHYYPKFVDHILIFVPWRMKCKPFARDIAQQSIDSNYRNSKKKLLAFLSQWNIPKRRSYYIHYLNVKKRTRLKGQSEKFEIKSCTSHVFNESQIAFYQSVHQYINIKTTW
jgi:hypothetical protein